MGRTVELGREPSVDWASLGPGGDLVMWKSWRDSMVSGCRVTMELSSLVASSTISRLGDFFLSRIAVV